MTDLIRIKYGIEWQPLRANGKPVCPMPDWMIERDMFLWDEMKDRQGNLLHLSIPRKHKGKAEHFRRMMTAILGQTFEWNPNAVRIVDEYFSHEFLAIAGHASSSKTETLAVIAVGEFIADPKNVRVMVTSTTLKDSRGRIWGRIEHYWNIAKEKFKGVAELPGSLVSSGGLIRYSLGGIKDETRGIFLVPGSESEANAGVGKLKGFKAPKMRVLGDEFADLSMKILDAAKGNLVSNKDMRLAAGFNPTDYFGPDGVLGEPEKGWGTVDILNSDGWKTKLGGYCIRFDGEKSPNVVAGKEIWKGLLTREGLAKIEKDQGRGTSGYISQARACWPEGGSKDSIYTMSEVIKYFGMQKVDVWEGSTELAAGFDPSFAHGGDRAVMVTGKVGSGLSFGAFKPCAEVQEVIYLDEKLDTSQDKREQILARLKEEMIKRGIKARHLAMDATGGGAVFATLMKRDSFFSSMFMEASFGGKASDMLVQGHKGKDKYVNLVSELWYAGKALLREGQIKGIKPEIVSEMTLRLYETKGEKIQVEPKENMKARLNGKSPDIADAFFLLIHVCRARLGLASQEKTAKPKKPINHDPLAGMFSWGQKKKPKLTNGEHVQIGGGWADEGQDWNSFMQR